MIPKEFGPRLKISRRQKHLNQTDISKRLNITRQAYSNYETGRCAPPVDVLAELTLLLDMISFLFFWKRLLPNYFIPIFNFIQKARIYHVRHNHLWSYAHSSPTPLRLHPERNSRIDRHLTFIVLSSGSGLPKANDGIFY